MTGIDPATRLLLDFISVRESGGNYNAVIGNAHSTDALSQRQLHEIYSLQANLVNIGRPSGAVGRYQFIHSTLATLAERKRLPQETLFTPALQDELAVQLLVGRGYSRWWLGHLSDDDFAHGLACEWASLPDPYNRGRSHYDGDAAGNHASRTLDEVAACLASVRKLIPAS